MSELYDRDDRQYMRVYKQETPDILAAFAQFDDAVFAKEGREIPIKYRELIALAVATVTQCVYCIQGHSKRAVAEGASDAEMAEAAWVATVLRAGAGIAHGRLAFKFSHEAPGHAHTGADA